MKGTEAWASYGKYTRGVTVHSRKLAFGGAALCWVLKEADGFSPAILAALGLIVLFFLFDLLQYCTGALRTYLWVNSEEERILKLNKRKGKPNSLEGEYIKTRSVDRPAFWLFWAKLPFLILGYICIGYAILTEYLRQIQICI